MLLLKEIGENIENHFILTDKILTNPPSGYLAPSQKMNIKEFWNWAVIQIKDIAARYNNTIIVNEHLNGIVNAKLKFSRVPNLIRIVSLYSGEFEFVMKKGWSVDSNYQKEIGRVQTLRIIKSRFKPLFLRFIAVWGSQIIVGNSSSAAKELKSIFKRKRYVLNTSLSLERMRKHLNQPAEVKQVGKRLKILYAGKIYPAKGIGTLFQAFNLLDDQQRSKIEVEIIGKVFNNDRDWFDKMMHSLEGRMTISYKKKVSQEELFKTFNDFHALVFPSFFEGSPRILKEAMMANLVIISSDIPGTKVLDESGKVIQFFDVGNAESLKKRLVELINNYDGMGSIISSGSEMIKKFDTKSIAAERIEFYKSLELS